MSAQQANNTTVRHEDPDETNQDGDLSRVSGVLAGQLGEISVDCSEGIRVGNYDACEELDADGEYGDALSKYVDVTGRDGDDEDSETAESYRDLQEEQQEFANETREFRQTYQEYQEARRNGNTSRARQLARELLELRGDIQRTGTNVSRSATEVSNRSGVSLESVEQNTRLATRNVSNTTKTVVTTVFLPTAMTATREGTGNISARDPLVVSGTVQTSNGSRVPNGSVVLATGPGRDAPVVSRTRAAVNASGEYRLSYQPTTVRTGNRTLSVRYVPPAASVYRAANVSVQATVEPVVATVALQDVTGTVRYGDTVGGIATLELAADGVNTSLPGVPLTTSLGGRELVTSRTGPDGRVTLRGPLPVRVAPGTQPLRVRGPSAGRAVVVEPTRQEVRVQSSATQLDARAVQTATGERRVRVVGRLLAQGEGIPEQEVAVRIGGQQVRTLRTNASGYYPGTVTVPNASSPAAGQASLSVVVAYDGTGTNLESARTRQAVSVRSGVAAESGVGDRIVAFVGSNPVAVGGGLSSVSGCWSPVAS
ncbi:hypothetical protein DP107_03090 [Haloglomus irregulare]|uniref:Uncharacterized protein n=1 Tax=Haloglomus irregulare TaxID=2234134 RepID=A0A554NFT0_9EURY|nr:hypothetical protein [Haloglomus irregulare]TSD16165.1 hypothetical protein DP107_03090 [Haloglomus irregulare]